MVYLKDFVASIPLGPLDFSFILFLLKVAGAVVECLHVWTFQQVAQLILTQTFRLQIL